MKRNDLLIQSLSAFFAFTNISESEQPYPLHRTHLSLSLTSAAPDFTVTSRIRKIITPCEDNCLNTRLANLTRCQTGKLRFLQGEFIH